MNCLIVASSIFCPISYRTSIISATFKATWAKIVSKSHTFHTPPRERICIFVKSTVSKDCFISKDHFSFKWSEKTYLPGEYQIKTSKPMLHETKNPWNEAQKT